MSNVTIQKRGNFYQYKFEIAKVDGKRKFLSKSGFKTKSEAEKEGVIAYNDYLNTGNSFSIKVINRIIDLEVSNGNVFDNLMSSAKINNIIKYEIAY